MYPISQLISDQSLSNIATWLNNYYLLNQQS
jgi:hypothetical protein